MESLRDGIPCNHKGCLSHISHPCEGCGRIGGREMTTLEKIKELAKKLREKTDYQSISEVNKDIDKIIKLCEVKSVD